MQRNCLHAIFSALAGGDGSLIPPSIPCNALYIPHSYMRTYLRVMKLCKLRPHGFLRFELNWIVCVLCACVVICEQFTYSNEEFDDIDFKMPCWCQSIDEPTKWMMWVNQWINFTWLVQWMCVRYEMDWRNEKSTPTASHNPNILKRPVQYSPTNSHQLTYNIHSYINK